MTERFPTVRRFSDRGIGFTLCILLAGCGSSASGEDANRGGSDAGGEVAEGRTDAAAGDLASSATGGVGGGSTGVGGTGGQQAPDAGGLGACFGVCLESFLFPCSKVGQPCTRTSVSATLTNTCYANGVKQQQTLLSGPIYVMATVKRPDGAICYQSARLSTTQDIADAAGDLIAHLDYSADNVHVIVDCGGTVTVADLGSAACAAFSASSAEVCATGSCTW
jgi:hypothetical protein